MYKIEFIMQVLNIMKKICFYIAIIFVCLRRYVFAQSPEG